MSDNNFKNTVVERGDLEVVVLGCLRERTQAAFGVARTAVLLLGSAWSDK